jgi:phospholipid/cholesterol/gamma-HCH transport system substrate-binding protein
VGRRPDYLRRVVSASHAVFDSLATEDQNISTSVARLPGSLNATERALSEVSTFAPQLRRTLESLREPVRKLPATNAALTPFFADTTPVLRDEIRPFVRTAGPFTDDLRLAARDIAKATPDLTTSLKQTNRFFNMGAYNPGGAQSLDGLSVPQQRARNEGFLYWLAWTAQNGVSLFNTADAQGPWRRVTICGVPQVILNSLITSVLNNVQESNPSLVEQLIGGAGSTVQPGSPIANLLATGFGSCNFNA